MRSVVAKFRVDTVTRHAHGYNEVKMSPVYAEDGPNKSWSEATPSGKIEMTITNPAAVDFFEAGQEYLLAFTKAEEHAA